MCYGSYERRIMTYLRIVDYFLLKYKSLYINDLLLVLRNELRNRFVYMQFIHFNTTLYVHFNS